VAGIPKPVYTKEELAQVVEVRRSFRFDQKLSAFPMIVVPPERPLKSLLVYKDKDGNEQPIKTPEHQKLKRQQTLEALQKVMGILPKRPKHTSLKDFKIRVTEENTVIRGRYKRQSIHYFVAEGEEVHAHLYTPLNMKPGEKRPAIVGMHPFAKWGKGSFEKWPNLNFPFELATQGFVVIMVDCPGFGEAIDEPYDPSRYASGRLKAVYNHMCTVDLLQLHPLVDGENIGTIGHSMGGGNAMFLTVFDERVKIGVTSCGWTTFTGNTLFTEKKLAGKPYLPRLKSVYNLDINKFPFEYTEVIATIVPRVFFSNSPTADGVQSGYRPQIAAPFIKEYFEACGAKENFIFVQPVAGHEFPWTYRQMAYKKFREILNYHPHGNLGLMADRKGKEAIPALKKALEDASQQTRRGAAHLLGTLGDKSGLTRMQKDFKTLAPKGALSDSIDAAGHSRLEEALEIARVLAELGDASGYEAAALLSTKGSGQERWCGIVALCHIANTDQAALKAIGRDPVSLLKTIAVAEKDEGVFFVLLDQVHQIFRSRTDMIAILAAATTNKNHQTPPPHMGSTRAQGYHGNAKKDKDRPFEWK
jgi:pimeloyl-ACP methyl ester carboxylesterase